MHVIPQLRKLEHKFRDSLVVIGVHSSKFPNERRTENVREAVHRYGIEHPVVNDASFDIWEQWGVNAWPTLMFVDPQGKVFGTHPGEFPYEQMEAAVADMVHEFDAEGWLDHRPLAFQLEAEEREKRPLSFPGKIEADDASQRLFVADSNHNRILITGLDGRVQLVIGSGDAGAADGAFETASFWRPQGMALVGDSLYVADAENHLLRRADLGRRLVDTVAGTGEEALYRHQGGEPLANPLNSPYDLAEHDGVLYIAMAGFHQIWALDLGANRIYPYAGSGAEGIEDGDPRAAQLAQPFGIKTDGRYLYVADSETSALRRIGFGPGAEVETLVGSGLFEFGDREGMGDSAQLQHVQGLAIGDGLVYLADTYNHKIKTYDVATKWVRSFAGSGEAALHDGPAADASFNEPAGLALLDGRLYVADTNNHVIRVVDLESRQVTTLDIQGL